MDVIGTLVIGWLAADFLSGFWHWLEDRYFREDWPVIGKYITIPNQLHHEQPSAFLGQGYWSRNWTTILPAVVFLAVAAIVHSPTWILVAIAGASQANEVHAWSHQRCNWAIRLVQETGVIQHPRSHAKHHREPFDRSYCVMTEWLNPLLDTFGFWSAMEWLIERTTTLKPRGAR